MKHTLRMAALAAALLIPALSFAQASNGPVTRAQVRAELAQLRHAGYRSTGRDNQYPSNLQAAEARIAAASGMAPGQAAPTMAPNMQ
ncbi:DUF4148 domain-containing protein [Paraburkholderia tagetis]|uniref:DUF4148 domain-containing protein n=1 Tax=Paraburkholderia tagetis TaxID=2913261 RepID=A0A9X1UFU0_9BURK|nr:DUF4148 domain-containing protein [Paraburkholderia tagetis]MCG5072308.1 DUF4148 domain-containing protein [Paraburkholderia tagetis]